MGARTRGFANNVLTAGKIDASDGLTGNLPNSNVNNTSVSGVTSLPPSVGSGIASVSSNPAAPAATGIVWYNTVDERFKIAASIDAWSSGPPTINLTNSGGGAGTQSSAVFFGGRNPPGPNFVAKTEEYNGVGWSASGDLNTARSYLAGFGTQTAAVAAGGRTDASGSTTNATEEYNGTTWTTVNNMGTARRVGGSAGIVQTAGLAIGGGPPGVTNNEEYDGTNWTAGGSLNTARFYLAGFGTLTSAVAAAGNGGGTATEEYNGSSWTTVNSLNNSRNQLGSSGSSETAGLIFGGEGPPLPTQKANTELYNGTTWSETSDLATARRNLKGAGNSGTSALAATGFPSYNLTEEFTSSVNVTTAGAWASGGNMTTARRAMSGGAGTATAGMVAGGYISANSNATEEYNGSAWANGGNLPVALYYISIAGTQTAGLAVGGGDPVKAEGIEYNGSSWTDIGNAPESRKMMGRSGTQTAALFAGGNDSSNAAAAEAFTYDGSSFSNITDLPSNRGSGHVAGGSQTATVHAGGSLGPPGYATTTVEWNGSAWGAGGNYLFPGQSQFASNNTSGYNNTGIGGYGTPAAPSGVTSVGCTYDGTSWATTTSISTARQQGSGFGGVDDFVICAGTTGSATNATEEFTGETSSLNVKTLTTS